jgi:hypothetical protein
MVAAVAADKNQNLLEIIVEETVSNGLMEHTMLVVVVVERQVQGEMVV